MRLGVMDDYGALVVPPLLASFVAGYPNIRVEMETGLTAAMPERLGEGYDSSSPCIRKAAAAANSCGESRRSGRRARRMRSKSGTRCQSLFIRRAVCSANGRRKRSTPPSDPGGSRSSVTVWRLWNPSPPKVWR